MNQEGRSTVPAWSPNTHAVKSQTKQEESDSGPCTRINWDKRSARERNATHFRNVIEGFKQRPLIQDHELGPLPNQTAVKVFVRKRPLLPSELKADAFDVITAISDSTVVVHNCLMNKDMKSMYINHEAFKAERVFDEASDNSQVFRITTMPLVQKALRGGLISHPHSQDES